MSTVNNTQNRTPEVAAEVDLEQADPSLPSVIPLWTKLKSRSKIDAETGCRLWTGAETSSGYGHMAYEGGYRKIHRLSYRIHKGAIPDGQVVRHIDDCHRRCINPDHLETGTQGDNIRDAGDRIGGKMGESRSKLTDDQISEIKMLRTRTEMSYADMSEHYPVNRYRIGQIIRRESRSDAHAQPDI